MSYSRKTYYSR
ncbi:hypothetical protein PENDEC_c026G07159 [Penicillium decumbens]|uniref:Uncharacterized protein n=1 Tax=Penicillium decumbens TaxID=69771 RepID=A0A1V6NZN6_PENDC|nr:hypothetical protein PENDEC_c026G07159 [Penicillium decumbens]